MDIESAFLDYEIFHYICFYFCLMFIAISQTIDTFDGWLLLGIYRYGPKGLQDVLLWYQIGEIKQNDLQTVAQINIHVLIYEMARMNI